MNDLTKNLSFVVSNTIDNIPFASIKVSPIHGFGLFSSRLILKDEIICKLDGQKISIEKYKDLQKTLCTKIKGLKKYFFMECTYINENELLARSLRTKYSYINHSRSPNTKINFKNMSVIAIKEIKKGDEILINYMEESLPEDYINGIEGKYL